MYKLTIEFLFKPNPTSVNKDVLIRHHIINDQIANIYVKNQFMEFEETAYMYVKTSQIKDSVIFQQFNMNLKEDMNELALSDEAMTLRFYMKHKFLDPAFPGTKVYNNSSLWKETLQTLHEQYNSGAISSTILCETITTIIEKELFSAEYFRNNHIQGIIDSVEEKLNPAKKISIFETITQTINQLFK